MLDRTLPGFPKFKLGIYPTAIQRFRVPGIEPNLILKREDLSGMFLGGNKIRKLEYILGRCLDSEINEIVGSGYLDSNFVRQLALSCKVANLNCTVFLASDRARNLSENDNLKNIKLLKTLGLNYSIVESLAEAIQISKEYANESHRDRYWCPPGGSDLFGVFAVSIAFAEFLRQTKSLEPRPTFLFTPCSSAGTAAGLVAGRAMARDQLRNQGILYLPKIIAVRVDKGAFSPDNSSDQALFQKIIRLAQDSIYSLGRKVVVEADDVFLESIPDDPGYGILRDCDVENQLDFFRATGVLVDSKYMAKTLTVLKNKVKNIGKRSYVGLIVSGTENSL